MEDTSLYFTAVGGENAYTGSASGVILTKSIPLSVARNIGLGAKKVYVEVLIKTALEGAGDTADIDLITDSVATMDSTPAVVKQAAVTFPAESPANTKLYFELPESPAAAYEEHLGLRVYARGSGALTAGAFEARLTLEPGIQALNTSSGKV